GTVDAVARFTARSAQHQSPPRCCSSRRKPPMNARLARRKTAATWIAAALLAACAPLPRAGDPSALWQPSPNFDERRPGFVVIHATGSDTAAHAMRTLTDARRRVSAHYLIARDGTVYQLVDERARAWHAGVSRWGANTDLNSVSLGIEL